ncbi:hypothetical protein HaLaN_12372 [Haematococcus lacustris]|uniref:Uncharacterized protein n=1 Tax=Haematococcus lacustris TaxID=44745 RepID=A0A699ZA83_HAELA|nr:hypothetical protein HaLaN_12372 [Haematococcus lacustris]
MLLSEACVVTAVLQQPSTLITPC